MPGQTPPHSHPSLILPPDEDAVPQNLSALVWGLFKRYGLQILPTALCLALIWWSRQDHQAELQRTERWLMVVEAHAASVRENTKVLVQHTEESVESDKELIRVYTATCVNQAKDQDAQRRCYGMER